MSKLVEFTKEEIHAVLQLASKFHNEHTSLPFTAAEIPDAVHKAISAAYSEVVAAAKTTTHAFGFVLRAFANEQVPVVVEALAAPVAEEKAEVVAKPSKKATKAVEPEVVVEPVVEEKEVAPVEVVETPAEEAAPEKAE